MATRQSTVDHILEQIAAAGEVSARKMFGEYGVYCDGKIVALICNDQLFVKPTAAGRAMAVGASEMPPYRGAKPSLLIDPELGDDREWLTTLIRATANALPATSPKRPSKRKLSKPG